MIEVQARFEGRRGCGFRKPGGIYLVAPATGAPCCKLPFPLTVCPTCGAGIHAARGWTWIDTDKLFFPNWEEGDPSTCKNLPHISELKAPCVLAKPKVIGMAGLIWVGEAFYKTADEFLSEANTMGVSRRISTVPKGFKLGETWVMLAHRKVIPYEADIKDGLLVNAGVQLTETKFKPAIFSIFKPAAIEYVVKGNETQADLEKLVKRGLTPVDVNPRKARR
jgi:hypothetical protein